MVNALDWLRNKAVLRNTDELVVKVGDEETKAGVYKVENYYFRGNLPMNMKPQLMKAAKELIKTNDVNENVRWVGRGECEYFKNVYTFVREN